MRKDAARCDYYLQRPGQAYKRVNRHVTSLEMSTASKCIGESTNSYAESRGKVAKRIQQEDWSKMDADVMHTRQVERAKGSLLGLEDHTLRARSTGTGRFDLQGDLGGLVEAFPDAAVLNGRAF